MRYCKPVTVHFEIRGPTGVIVVSERVQGPGRLLGRRWTHYVGKRSSLKAVEKARISHSDDVTSSNALLNQWLRGFLESSLFSEVTTMVCEVLQYGMKRAAARQRVFEIQILQRFTISILACCNHVLRTTSAILPSSDPSFERTSCSRRRRTHACSLRQLLAPYRPLEIRPLHTWRSCSLHGSREGQGPTRQGTRAGKRIGSGMKRPDRWYPMFPARGRSVR